MIIVILIYILYSFGTDILTKFLDESNLKDFLLQRVEKVDFKELKADVERFLEDKSDLKLLEKDVVTKGIIDVFAGR